MLRGTKVKVYWNIRKKHFSVQVKGRVVASATHLALANVKFLVSQKGRERVIREKAKNVHAFITGTLALPVDLTVTPSGYATYNPYANTTFVDKQDGRPVGKALCANLWTNEGRPVVCYTGGSQC